MLSWLFGSIIFPGLSAIVSAAIPVAIAAGVIAFIKTLFLRRADIITALRGWQSIKEQDKDIIGFLVEQAEANGKIRHVTGLYDKRHKKILVGNQYESDDCEQELKNLKEIIVFDS